MSKSVKKDFVRTAVQPGIIRKWLPVAAWVDAIKQTTGSVYTSKQVTMAINRIIDYELAEFTLNDTIYVIASNHRWLEFEDADASTEQTSKEAMSKMETVPKTAARSKKQSHFKKKAPKRKAPTRKALSNKEVATAGKEATTKKEKCPNKEEDLDNQEEGKAQTRKLHVRFFFVQTAALPKPVIPTNTSPWLHSYTTYINRFKPKTDTKK